MIRQRSEALGRGLCLMAWLFVASAVWPQGVVPSAFGQQQETWDAPRSRVPNLPRLARRTVAHDELFASPENPIRPAAPEAEPAGDETADPEITDPEITDPEITDPEITDPEITGWHRPEALLKRLEALAADPATARWATDTAAAVRNLGPTRPAGSQQATPIIARLDELAAEAKPLAATLGPDQPISDLLRAGYALRRRLDIWRTVVQIPVPDGPTVDAKRPEHEELDPQRLSTCLLEIDRATGGSAEGRAWREYLMIDALREWSDRDPPPEGQLSPALAKRVLDRLTQIPMDASQQRFVSDGPISVLRSHLQRQLIRPVDPTRLVRHVERYEQTGLASDAWRLAEDCRLLGLSTEEPLNRLAGTLTSHYRNANLRVTVTGELINRLVPEREPEEAAVRDRVLGVPVFGRSKTAANVVVRLVPDPDRIRMELEVKGTVASLTSSSSGPARFVNNGWARYTAKKPIEFNLDGIHLGRSRVWVANGFRLRKVETEYDGMPLIGPLAKGIARSEHERNREAAVEEMRRKIAAKARERIDTEAEAQLGKVSQRMRENVLQWLHALSLDPAMIGSQTSEQRFTMRLRLAGADQLGGHTPRPMAPSGCLASVQIHQTAINNVLGRLELDGRTFTMLELAEHVAARLRLAEPWDTDPENDDVKITFAERDAVGIKLHDGGITLTLAIDRLWKSRRQQWKNFTVCVVLRPEVEDLWIDLVRKGGVHLEGPGVTTGSRFALSGIFSQLFSKKRPFCLTPDRIGEHPKLTDMEVTQFHIEDGWLGAAVGQKPPVPRTVLRRR